MENAKKFFEEVAKTEEVKALFASMEAPKSEEERIRVYIEIAAKLGTPLTLEGTIAYLKTLDSLEPAEGEVDDEELQQLVGGGDKIACEDTYRDGENCWWNDACDMLLNDFGGYACSHHYKGRTLLDTIGDAASTAFNKIDYITDNLNSWWP